MSYALDGSEEVGYRIEPQSTLSEFPPRNHLGMQSLAKRKSFTDTNLPTRTNQRFPIALADLLYQQRLALPLQKLLCRSIAWAHRLRVRSAAMSVKARRKHLRIVEDDKVTFPKQVRKLAEHAIADLAVITSHVQHARGGAIHKRFLRDQFFGKVEVEVGDEHELIVYCRLGIVYLVVRDQLLAILSICQFAGSLIQSLGKPGQQRTMRPLKLEVDPPRQSQSQQST
jgi:hypothetical protein